jgi:hypothetical protein
VSFFIIWDIRFTSEGSSALPAALPWQMLQAIIYQILALQIFVKDYKVLDYCLKCGISMTNSKKQYRKMGFSRSGFSPTFPWPV